MKLNFDMYRPDPKWGVDDQEWECWMLEFIIYNPNYAYEYNSYLVSKVKSEILKNIVPPEEISKRRSERKAGRWRRVSGLDPDDRRPQYLTSLATFGDLFFGTTSGYHREFVPEKGKKFAMQGSFIILWDCDRDLDQQSHPKCQYVQHQLFYNSLVTVYALVEEAANRGDTVTLLTLPQAVDDMMPAHAKIEARRAPIFPADYVNADGNWNFHYDDMFSQLKNWGRETIYPPSDGLLPSSWKRHTIQLEKQGHLSPGTGEVSKYYYWMNSKDYDTMKEDLLKFVFNGHGVATELGVGMVYLQRQLNALDKSKRGTIVIITALPTMGWFWPGYHYYRALSKHFDMYIFDISYNYWYMTFLKEPNFMLNGKPMFGYVNLNTLFTLSPVNVKGFVNLNISAYSNVLTITLNTGQDKIKQYQLLTLSTVSELMTEIQKDFPELVLDRYTIQNYPTELIRDYSMNLPVKDGKLALLGPDGPNMTYKILKVIGGGVDGVSVT